MPQVISFTAYRPPRRYDDLPWTDAQIEEASDPSGSWTVIDTVPLDPLDSNPASPRFRNLTTENATDTPELWYRIIFLDADADESQPTTPVQNAPDDVAETGGNFGPCTAWVDGADVAECCDADVGSFTSLLDDAATLAGQLLYELTGRRYPGTCERTVRPCNQDRPCGFQTLSRGHLVWDTVGWSGRRWEGARGVGCGCQPLSEIPLPGIPLVGIVEVKIDGDVVDPDEYGLIDGRALYRKADADGKRQLWPSCQRLDLDDDQPGTFSITYQWGSGPPQAGVDAARQLACELFKACPGNVDAGDCEIPAGVTRITRQGVTFERKEVRSFLTSPPTGLVMVDAFLGAYGRVPRRRSAVWTPDVQPFPVRLT